MTLDLCNTLEWNLRLQILNYLLIISVVLSVVCLWNGQLLAIIEESVSLTQC